MFIQIPHVLMLKDLSMHMRNIVLRLLVYVIVLLGGLTQILPSSLSMSNQTHNQQPAKKSITIFVHGTLFSQCFSRLFDKNVLEQKSSGRIAQIFTSLETDNNCFYYYQWSGSFTEHARRNAGRDLFYSLQELPKDASITLITHSHGGNVVLHCAKYAQTIQHKNFSIDRLILLGCPVQQQTVHYIPSQFFKQIYAFHSLDDGMQTWDPQFTHALVQLLHGTHASFFSKRVFPNHDNLQQIQIIGRNKKFGHFDFISTEFLEHIPHIIPNIEHTEMTHGAIKQYVF